MEANINIFQRSIPIIKSLVKTMSNNPKDDIDDCIQQCWFAFCKAMKVARPGAHPKSIYAYLKIWYRHECNNWIRRGRRYILVEDIYFDNRYIEDKTNETNTQIDLSCILTEEEKNIVQLRLDGYEKSEITDIIKPNNNYISKKSKDVFTYRKMVPIKKNSQRI